MDINSDGQILILGGGFAGLSAALYLSDAACPLPIKLIDQNPQFVFKPLLYELLAEEDENEVVWPRYGDLLQNSQVDHVLGTVNAIDLNQQQVKLANGETHSYRYLVIALGDVSGNFGTAGAKANTLTFRSGEDVLALRQRLQNQLQTAIQKKDPEARRSHLTVAIIGAGPAGVELAATLADLLPRWYENLEGDGAEPQIVLIHSGSEILETLASNDLRELVEQSIAERQGTVTLQLAATVQEIQSDRILYRQNDQEQSLEAGTIIWAAGSETHPLVRSLPLLEVHCDERGRPYLTAALQLIGFPEVFAGGDCAIDVHAPLPATAQVAYQQGKGIARNVMRLIEGDEAKPVDIQFRGMVMKLGLEAGAVELLERITISGKAGHLIRQAAYRSLLPTPARNFKLGAEWLADELLEGFLGN